MPTPLTRSNLTVLGIGAASILLAFYAVPSKKADVYFPPDMKVKENPAEIDNEEEAEELGISHLF